MGRLYRPESEKPKRGEVAEDPVTYGRIYVTGDAEPEPESEDSGAVVVTEPAEVPADGEETVEEPAEPELEEPAGNASREEWATYARARGAGDEDLVDETGQDLGRDALRAKFGTPSA